MGFRVCRDFYRKSNSGKLLSGCVLQDACEVVTKRVKFRRAFRRHFDLSFFPDESVLVAASQLDAEISVDDVRRWRQHFHPSRRLLTQDDGTVSPSQAQSTFVRRNRHRPKPGRDQLLQNLHLSWSKFEHAASTRRRQSMPFQYTK